VLKLDLDILSSVSIISYSLPRKEYEKH
ncbi:hypothetical protein, partial [Sicyoidochytrium minutum DNA virus]